MANVLTSNSRFKLLLFFIDCLCFLIAIEVANFFRLDFFITSELFTVCIFWMPITFLIFYVFDLYNLEDPLGILKILFKLFIAILVSILTIIFLSYLIGIHAFSGVTGRGVMIGGYFLFFLLAIFFRKVILYHVRKFESLSKWLVFGTRDFLLPLIKDHLKLNTGQCLACLTPVSAVSSGVEPMENEEKFVVGSWTSAQDFLKQSWKGIILASGQKIPKQLMELILKKRFEGLRVFDLTDFYEHNWRKVPIFYLEEKWFVISKGFQLLHNPIGLRLKRLGDIFCAVILAIISLPIFIFSAFIVLITSGRPIIYKQKRTGLNGEVFIIYKFRSMKKDAEKQGPQWAKAKDERVTQWGKFMRKTRIDELPQILNILKGDMSFIGPRPERPEFVLELKEKIPYFDFRHLVRPGLTGWAQVMYPYGANVEDAKEKLQYDLFYIKNYSLLLDWIVLLKTVKVVLFGKGR